MLCLLLGWRMSWPFIYLKQKLTGFVFWSTGNTSRVLVGYERTKECCCVVHLEAVGGRLLKQGEELGWNGTSWWIRVVIRRVVLLYNNWPLWTSSCITLVLTNHLLLLDLCAAVCVATGFPAATVLRPTHTTNSTVAAGFFYFYFFFTKHEMRHLTVIPCS